MQIISGYWEAVGVKTKVTPIDQGALRSMYLARPLDPKLAGTTYPFNGSSSRDVLSRIWQTFGSTGSSPLIQDPGWDDLYNKTVAEFDQGKRIQLLRQLNDQGHDQYAAINTVSVQTVFAVSKQVGEWRVLSNSLSQVYEGVQHK